MRNIWNTEIAIPVTSVNAAEFNFFSLHYR